MLTSRMCLPLHLPVAFTCVCFCWFVFGCLCLLPGFASASDSSGLFFSMTDMLHRSFSQAKKKHAHDSHAHFHDIICLCDIACDLHWFVQVASALQTSGTRLLTKTQICLSCFGSTNLGRSASFKSSDGLFYLDVWLWFSFPPLILSFHRPCAPRQPRWSLSHYFGHDPSHSMHLANEFGLTALASVSSSRPPQLGICCCR